MEFPKLEKGRLQSTPSPTGFRKDTTNAGAMRPLMETSVGLNSQALNAGQSCSTRIPVNLVKEWVSQNQEKSASFCIWSTEDEEPEEQYYPVPCNPVVLVPEKDSTIRFCIDFRSFQSTVGPLLLQSDAFWTSWGSCHISALNR